MNSGENVIPGGFKFKDIVWFNVFFLIAVHIGAAYGVYAACCLATWRTNVFALMLWPITGMGITMGVHRLWSHRSYKAHWSVRLFLAVLNAAAYQGSIFEWSRDHRVHHKCSETDGDPYNANRGMFFSHIGWVFLRKHREVIRQGQKIDCSDLLADPIVMYQAKFYLPLVAVFCYGLPTLACWYMGDSLLNGFLVAGVVRHVFVLHCTWCVNSLAHAEHWGYRPYSEKIAPGENILVTIGAVGEGWHNYHHMFPTDYSASEYGWHRQYNPSTLAIDLLAALGLVWDRRKTDATLVQQKKAEVIERTHAKAH